MASRGRCTVHWRGCRADLEDTERVCSSRCSRPSASTVRCHNNHCWCHTECRLHESPVHSHVEDHRVQTCRHHSRQRCRRNRRPSRPNTGLASCMFDLACTTMFDTSRPSLCRCSLMCPIVAHWVEQARRPHRQTPRARKKSIERSWSESPTPNRGGIKVISHDYQNRFCVYVHFKFAG